MVSHKTTSKLPGHSQPIALLLSRTVLSTSARHVRSFFSTSRESCNLSRALKATFKYKNASGHSIAKTDLQPFSAFRYIWLFEGRHLSAHHIWRKIRRALVYSQSLSLLIPIVHTDMQAQTPKHIYNHP